MILTTDTKELFEQADDKYAVMCVQHDYKVTESTKMDGQKQTISHVKIGPAWYYGTVDILAIKLLHKIL